LVLSYRVETPANGLWQIRIEAAATAEFEAFAVGASPLLVHIFRDQGVYRPGETVTLETGVLEEPGTLHTLALPSPRRCNCPTAAPLRSPSTTTAPRATRLAGDNLYAAQFTAPAANADLEIVVQATKGNIVRFDSLLVPVVAQTATLLGVGNERTVDTNGNGFFDAVTIDVAIDVLEAGDYDVTGDLYAGSGDKLADGVFTTLSSGEPLTAGMQTVTLSFDGKTLREAGIDGPYVLDHLEVDHHAAEFDLPMTVDSARTVYTTTAYTANQFEGDALRVVATHDHAADLTGDGLYDSLTISVTFDVLQPGLYEWHGLLVDGAGAQVAQASRRGELDSQTPAAFTFAGGQLVGEVGPYTLTNVFITRLAETVETFYFDDVHRTAAYQTGQFGTTPLVMTGAHAAIDLNGNGLYDQLLITATVAAILPEGEYAWSGQLVGPTGVAVGTPITGSGQLYPGRSIPFVVYSPPLHQANLDGAYSLQSVVITHRELPTVTVAMPLLYTTPPFPAAQFDPWDLQAAGIGAQAVDANANGLYDKLIFTTTMNIPLPGAYDMEYVLVSQQAPETVIWATSWSWWYPQGPITKAVAFTGPVIADAGVDGPYMLKLVNATYYPPDAGEGISFVLVEAQNLYTTATYTASQFEGFQATPTPTATPASTPTETPTATPTETPTLMPRRQRQPPTRLPWRQRRRKHRQPRRQRPIHPPRRQPSHRRPARRRP
jgi:hypothetical protein